ncbi:serine/arginine repetitive matrix protein 1-like [Hetaerina americana]|uniref:serine/arginine repetitive matrix protein 1-like n=1 Tax=Hetaerina americana TaxID=62018 RepID=UPI003A7F3979
MHTIAPTISSSASWLRSNEEEPCLCLADRRAVRMEPVVKMNKHQRKLRADDIGLPGNYQHVLKVAWNKDGQLEVTNRVQPEMKDLFHMPGLQIEQIQNGVSMERRIPENTSPERVQRRKRLSTRPESPPPFPPLSRVEAPDAERRRPAANGPPRPEAVTLKRSQTARRPAPENESHLPRGRGPLARSSSFESSALPNCSSPTPEASAVTTRPPPPTTPPPPEKFGRSFRPKDNDQNMICSSCAALIMDVLAGGTMAISQPPSNAVTEAMSPPSTGNAPSDRCSHAPRDMVEALKRRWAILDAPKSEEPAENQLGHGLWSSPFKAASREPSHNSLLSAESTRHREEEGGAFYVGKEPVPSPAAPIKEVAAPRAGQLNSDPRECPAPASRMEELMEEIRELTFRPPTPPPLPTNGKRAAGRSPETAHAPTQSFDYAPSGSGRVDTLRRKLTARHADAPGAEARSGRYPPAPCTTATTRQSRFSVESQGKREEEEATSSASQSPSRKVAAPRAGQLNSDPRECPAPASRMEELMEEIRELTFRPPTPPPLPTNGKRAAGRSPETAHAPTQSFDYAPSGSGRVDTLRRKLTARHADAPGAEARSGRYPPAPCTTATTRQSRFSADKSPTTSAAVHTEQVDNEVNKILNGIVQRRCQNFSKQNVMEATSNEVNGRKNNANTLTANPQTSLKPQIRTWHGFINSATLPRSKNASSSSSTKTKE